MAREVHENVVEGWSSQADVNDLNVLCGEFNHHRAESLHTFGDRNRNERLLIVDADGPYCEWSNERLNARKVLGEREVDIEMLPPPIRRFNSCDVPRAIARPWSITTISWAS